MVATILSSHRCETSPLMLRKEHKLVVSKKRVLKKTFGLKWGETTWGWRKLYKELDNLYSLQNTVRVKQSQRLRWADHVACMGRKERKNERKKERSVSINNAINCYKCSVSCTWMTYEYTALVKWWQGNPQLHKGLVLCLSCVPEKEGINKNWYSHKK